MKKILITLSTPLLAITLIGADFHREVSPQPVPVVVKKKCVGYTIIEFGKGIDCNGDTVKLVKVNGGQVLAKSLEPTSDIVAN